MVKGDLLTLDLSMKLLGRHNVENVLVALGLGVSLGLDLEGMVDALPMFPGVPGRLERVDEGGPFTVAVDYAHTPDSVERILAMGRVIAEGRVIAVLGCGGDRDRTKRPLMGLAMEKGAHVAILTSDNPRSEDPAAIIEEMTAALEHPETVRIEVDRRKAIEAAIAMAEPGDLVLILGKGHESGQESLGVVTPFDDRVVAREALWESGSLRS